MLSDILMWNKIGRVVTRLAKRLNIAPERAFTLFYESQTCVRLHDPEDFLYTMSDLYIVDELIFELRGTK